VFADAVTVTFPLPNPLAGLSARKELFVDAVHEHPAAAVTERVTEPPFAMKLIVVADSAYEQLGPEVDEPPPTDEAPVAGAEPLAVGLGEVSVPPPLSEQPAARTPKKTARIEGAACAINARSLRLVA
jgi:hypothetical protein